MNELPQSQSSRVLLTASAVTFLGFFDNNLLVPVIALYASELGASVGIIGLIVGLYSLTNTPANILFGRLIDKVGYKIPLVAAMFGDAISMYLYSITRLPVHLALVRVLHGITGALIGPATMSVIAGYSKKAQKGRAMAFYGISIGASTLVAFGLSGILVSGLGYKALFLTGAVFAAVGLVLSLWLPGNRIPADIEAKTSRGEGWGRVKSLLRRRGLVVSYCSIFAHYFTLGSVVTLLPLFVKNLGMEAFHVGMSMATFSIVFIILQFPSGALSDRVGRLVPAIVGLSLGIVALVLMPSITSFPMLLAVMALYGIEFGMLFPSISALVADNTTPDERGMATGIFHALLTAGIAIGAPVMGWVGSMVGVSLGLILSAGIMVLALLVAVTALRR